MNSFLCQKELPFIGEKPTIVIGADVTKPSINQTGGCSISSIVASMDSQCARHIATFRFQSSQLHKNCCEYIHELTDMIMEQFKNFSARCGGLKPRRMIFFRDGAGESCQIEIHDREISFIYEAFKKLYGEEKEEWPKVTYIFVQKRHHCKIFPVIDENDLSNRNDLLNESKENIKISNTASAHPSITSDKCGNVFPGTVVDSGITDPHGKNQSNLTHRIRILLMLTSGPSRYIKTNALPS